MLKSLMCVVPYMFCGTLGTFIHIERDGDIHFVYIIGQDLYDRLRPRSGQIKSTSETQDFLPKLNTFCQVLSQDSIPKAAFVLMEGI